MFKIPSIVLELYNKEDVSKTKIDNFVKALFDGELCYDLVEDLAKLFPNYADKIAVISNDLGMNHGRYFNKIPYLILEIYKKEAEEK